MGCGGGETFRSVEPDAQVSERSGRIYIGDRPCGVTANSDSPFFLHFSSFHCVHLECFVPSWTVPEQAHRTKRCARLKPPCVGFTAPIHSPFFACIFQVSHLHKPQIWTVPEQQPLHTKKYSIFCAQPTRLTLSTQLVLLAWRSFPLTASSSAELIPSSSSSIRIRIRILLARSTSSLTTST